MNDYFILSVRGTPYMSVKDLAEAYGMKPATIYSHLKLIEECGRYKNHRPKLNDNGAGDLMVNTLVYEDFLYFRSKLKNKNLAKNLPPYDPEEVRRCRGEYKQAVHLEEVDKVITQSETLKSLDTIYEAMKQMYRTMQEVFERKPEPRRRGA